MSYDDVTVSVTVMTYNHSKYLSQALDSILGQKVNFSYEIIIGDDASTDDTKEIINHYKNLYPELIKVVLHENNIGPSKNLYTINNVSSGKYIAVLEGDDYWIDENKLQKQIDFLESNVQFIGCASKYLKIDENGKPLRIRYASNRHYHKQYTMSHFLKGNVNRLLQFGSLVYRNIFKYNTDYSIIYKAHSMICDGTILSILLDLGPIYLFPEQLNAYRVKRKTNAENAVTLMSKNPLKYTLGVLDYADSLEKHFDYKYSFNAIRNIGVDFSINNRKLLNKAQKEELFKIIKMLKITNKIKCLLRFIKSRIRYYLLYLPKILLKWS